MRLSVTSQQPRHFCLACFKFRDSCMKQGMLYMVERRMCQVQHAVPGFFNNVLSKMGFCNDNVALYDATSPRNL